MKNILLLLCIVFLAISMQSCIYEHYVYVKVDAEKIQPLFEEMISLYIPAGDSIDFTRSFRYYDIPETYIKRMATVYEMLFYVSYNDFKCGASDFYTLGEFLWIIENKAAQIYDPSLRQAWDLRKGVKNNN